MRRAACTLLVIGLLSCLVSCKKQESDTDGIRSGINEHLAGLKTLNLGAMDMNIQSVTIQGNQAQAQVEFRPKSGGPQGAGMQVAYSLEKQNGVWIVQTTQPTGGMISHPGPGENSHTSAVPPSSSSLPNFHDLVHGEAGAGSPPGHPPINPQGNARTQ
jgi:hypothetical protein